MSRLQGIRRQRGFTLLELLVVMVVMAVMSAAAISTLTFAFGDEEIETEARRIGALVGLASEEALLTGREIGMELHDHRVNFWAFDDIEQRWLPLGQDGGPFRTRELPERIETDLVLEGQPVVLGNNDADDEDASPDEDESDLDEAQPEPQVLMFSSGQMTAFTLVLEDPELEREWRIEADLLGRVKVEPAE